MEMHKSFQVCLIICKQLWITSKVAYLHRLSLCKMLCSRSGRVLFCVESFSLVKFFLLLSVFCLSSFFWLCATTIRFIMKRNLISEEPGSSL